MENIPIDLRLYLELLKAWPTFVNCQYYVDNEPPCACLFSQTVRHYAFNTLITTQDNPVLLEKCMSFYEQQCQNHTPINIELYHSIDSPPALTLAGYKLIRNYITITRSLHTYSPPHLPKNVTLKRVTTQNEVKEWMQLQKIDHYFSDDDINHIQQQLNNPINTLHLFLLYQNTQPANASLAHIQGDHIYIGFNITHHDFRNHGLGKLAMEIRLNFAKEQGCTQAYGMANSSSLPLVLQLEFKPLAMMTDYVLAKEGA